MTDHTVKAFTEKLEALSASIAQMGGLAEAQLADAVDAIAKRDTALAEGAVGGDRQIDQLQQTIEDQALKLLALRQPMAVDLRETLAAIKIASELERIGDLAKNIAKRAIVLNREPPIRLTQCARAHGPRRRSAQLKLVLDAYSDRDAKAAESGLAPGRRDRRDLQQPVPRTADLHDGRSAHDRARARICCSSPRTSSAPATTPPTSPRSSITW